MLDHQNNEFVAPEALRTDGKIACEFTGGCASVVIGELAALSRCHVTAGHGASVQIGDGGNIGDLRIYAAAGSTVRIGRGLQISGRVRLLLHEPRSIEIGDDCLIAGDVDITISDMHSIVDATTKRRLNPPASVTIGRHVWIGQRSTILKGSEIGDGSVIGAHSVVTGRIPARVVAAGVPARVLRKNATWSAELLPLAEPELQKQRRSGLLRWWFRAGAH